MDPVYLHVFLQHILPYLFTLSCTRSWPMSTKVDIKPLKIWTPQYFKLCNLFFSCSLVALAGQLWLSNCIINVACLANILLQGKVKTIPRWMGCLDKSHQEWGQQNWAETKGKVIPAVGDWHALTTYSKQTPDSNEGKNFTFMLIRMWSRRYNQQMRVEY